MKIHTINELSSRIRELYHLALTCQQHSSELQESLTKYIRKEINRTTGKVKPKAVYSTYEKGAVNMALNIYDSLFSANLEFCYKYNGEFYSVYKYTTKKSVEALYAMNVDIDSLERGQVYIGSDKVFYGMDGKTGTFKG